MSVGKEIAALKAILADLSRIFKRLRHSPDQYELHLRQAILNEYIRKNVYEQYKENDSE